MKKNMCSDFDQNLFLKSVNLPQNEEKLSEKITKITVEYKRDEVNKKDASCVSFFTPSVWDMETDELLLLRNAMAEEIRKMIKTNLGVERITTELTVLVVGLGNGGISSDSLGATTVKKIIATNHLPKCALMKMRKASIATIIPNVIGNTGIETADIVNAVAGHIDPNIIIAVDSLSAGVCDRLARTYQIWDSGIYPGRGIRNSRKEITFNTANVPIISLGIPTVVNSSTMIVDLLKKLSVENIDVDDISEVLGESMNFNVTPDDIDIIIGFCSELLAGAIDIALSVE